MWKSGSILEYAAECTSEESLHRIESCIKTIFVERFESVRQTEYFYILASISYLILAVLGVASGC